MGDGGIMTTTNARNGVSIEIESCSDNSVSIIFRVYTRDINFECRRAFDRRDYSIGFVSDMFDYLKCTVLEQIEKCNAVNWDKDKILEMME
jgi:hypothetical protein